jgi:hypothetical protein
VTEVTPPGGSDYAAPANTAEPLSVRQGSQLLGEMRRSAASAPPPQEQAAPPDNSPPAEDRSAQRDERGRFARAQQDEQESGVEPVDAAPDADQAPGEEKTEQDDPAEKLPSIDPPRSWTKDEKERFKTLPRELQAYVSERERARETELRRGQNEIAEQRKAADESRQQYERARQQYEAALPQVLSQLQSQQAGQFSDIKTWDDVQRLARDDWPRYVEWDAHNKRIQAVRAEMQQVQQRQSHEAVQKFAEFAKEQDRIFKERAPEFADPEKAPQAAKDAFSYMTETVGFTPEEVERLWSGHEKISLRDARVQTLIYEGMKRQAAVKALDKAVKEAASRPKPTPPVQRPGVATNRNESRATEIETLSRKLDEGTGGIRDKLAAGAALLKAQRAQAARRGA